MTKSRTFLGEVVARWKSETPSFFKKIRTFGISLVPFGAALIAIDGQLPDGVSVPETLIYVAGQCLWIGPAMAAIATLVVKPEYVDAVEKTGPSVPTVADIKEGKGE